MTNILIPLSEVEKTTMLITPGVQVLSIPDHIQKKYRDAATGEMSDRVTKLLSKELWSPGGVQHGFVTSVASNRGCFCRYFLHANLGNPRELRTKSNSELTPWHYLFLYEKFEQEYIDNCLQRILDGNL